MVLVSNYIIKLSFFPFNQDVKVFETGKKTTPKMDGASLSFSKTGAKLGAVLSNGTYIWNTQSGVLFIIYRISNCN